MQINMKNISYLIPIYRNLQIRIFLLCSNHIKNTKGQEDMLKLNLKKNETRFKNVENDLLALFFSSATSKSNKTFRFAKVDNNLTAFLPYLTDGAVKLYLYYALAA